MIYNETQQLSYTENGLAAFAISAQGIAVTKPDGSPVSGLNASATPGNVNSFSQVLVSSAFVIDMAGIWRALWNFTVGSRVLRVPEWYVATYDGVHNEIRRLLEQDSSDLPDNKIDPELVKILRIWGQAYPSVVYRSLTDPIDQYWYDQALIFLGAARVRRSQLLEKPNGALRRETQGAITYEFYEGAKRTTPLEDDWISQAWEALTNVTSIGINLANFRADFQLWAVSGPRRGVEEGLGTSYDRQPLYVALLDQRALD